MSHPTEDEKEIGKKLSELYTAMLGVLLGLTPIIIYESNFALYIAALLTLTTHFMVIDDWWMSYSLFKKYPPKMTLHVYYTLIWFGLFLSLYIILIGAGKGLIPLTVYLLLLSVMSLVDAGGVCITVKEYPDMKHSEKEDYVQMITWMIMGPVAAVFFFVGYMLLEIGASVEVTSVTILVMYLIRRLIDLLAPHLYLAVTKS
jgi:hypothetical protein